MLILILITSLSLLAAFERNGVADAKDFDPSRKPFFLCEKAVLLYLK